MSREKQTTAQIRRPSRNRPRLRQFGLPAAWVAGLWCGWRIAGRADLFSAAARGAAVWLAVLILWTVCARMCERAWSGACTASNEAAEQAAK